MWNKSRQLYYIYFIIKFFIYINTFLTKQDRTKTVNISSFVCLTVLLSIKVKKKTVF